MNLISKFSIDGKEYELKVDGNLVNPIDEILLKKEDSKYLYCNKTRFVSNPSSGTFFKASRKVH